MGVGVRWEGPGPPETVTSSGLEGMSHADLWGTSNSGRRNSTCKDQETEAVPRRGPWGWECGEQVGSWKSVNSVTGMCYREETLAWGSCMLQHWRG